MPNAYIANAITYATPRKSNFGFPILYQIYFPLIYQRLIYLQWIAALDQLISYFETSFMTSQLAPLTTRLTMHESR